MLIIPAIDILDGKVVRLQKGDFATAKSYSDHPVDQAKIYDESGFEWIHIVDLSGSKDGIITSLKILEEIKKNTKLKIEFGGGIRNVEDISKLFSIGVDKVVVGSLPVLDKPEFETVVETFPPDKIIIAADTKKGEVVVKGWSENSYLEISVYITQCKGYGINNYLITDIDKDGMLEGPNLRLYHGLKELFPDLFLIASGGIRGKKDLEDLKEYNCNAAIVGKAIYENKIDLKELSKFD
ncbi:MAG: 1-(5-phosphoribosyl)-5-[(5-phosphoribosylamino)methylideneamino]imidazole-4-carboxamide isomerase [Ignavibacteriales bacterium]|nr:1-(5-phosphoribosyl)-5-[(5-phosphoribosylamino)methylideneamino]imidazole-4-carboxamide isomerase [Ignavibacteriales bacterium]